jgi:hypothetical protein
MSAFLGRMLSNTVFPWENHWLPTIFFCLSVVPRLQARTPGLPQGWQRDNQSHSSTTHLQRRFSDRHGESFMVLKKPVPCLVRSTTGTPGYQLLLLSPLVKFIRFY